MRIALAADHRGADVAPGLVDALRADGHEVDVHGTFDGEPSDYPDLAHPVGCAVRDGIDERGVLVCGSGIGMAMAANKVRGVRAAVVEHEEAARMSRRHNDANVICLSADRQDLPTMLGFLRTWLAEPFEGGRHARRVAKIEAMERGVDPRETVVAEPAR